MRLSDLDEHARQLRAMADAFGAQVEAAKAQQDPFAAHYFASRQRFRRAIDGDTKSGKRSERALVESYKQATDLGFKGSIRQWEGLLTICLWRAEVSPQPSGMPLPSARTNTDFANGRE